MDDGQMTHMNQIPGMDNFDLSLENIEMYTSSFN